MSKLNFPDTIKYTLEHTWLRINSNGTATVGISDFAQDQLGEVAYVDLPAIGAKFEGNAEFGSVESIKAVNALYMPISGTVKAVNDALSDNPSLVNTDPYNDGWMLEITIADGADEKYLVSAADYEASLS